MGLLSNTLIGCLLAALPGPPSVKIEDAHISLFPVNKLNRICPGVDPKRDITFHLYRSESANESHIITPYNDNQLKASHFNLNQPVIVYLHGYMESKDAISSETIRTAYLILGGHNIIVVDSTRLYTGPWYDTAIDNSQVVGKYTAKLIDYLVSRGVPLKSIHVIGHSLGSHAAGSTGYYVKSGKLPRITGLDPAGPGFQEATKLISLDESDAEFVDIIHTDNGMFGGEFVNGHVDIYPNGGEYPQPKCKVLEAAMRTKMIVPTVFCSHLKSVYYYAQAVLRPDLFLAQRCTSWGNFLNGGCKNNHKIYLGKNTDRRARGKYFISVPANSVPTETLDGLLPRNTVQSKHKKKGKLLDDEETD